MFLNAFCRIFLNEFIFVCFFREVRKRLDEFRHKHQKDVSALSDALRNLEEPRGVHNDLGGCRGNDGDDDLRRPPVKRPHLRLEEPPPPPLVDDDDCFRFRPVGRITKSWFVAKNGTPRQPSICQESKGVLDLSDMRKNFGASNVHHSLENLTEFSHVWLLFVFHQSLPSSSAADALAGNPGSMAKVKVKVAPPRLGGKRVGVFSTRSPHRPNLIGLTLSRVVKVEGALVHLAGIDLVQGTPVLDIKPYIPDYDVPRCLLPNRDCLGVEPGPSGLPVQQEASAAVTVPEWVAAAGRQAQKVPSKVEVMFTARALAGLSRLRPSELQDDGFQSPEALKRAIEDILVADPRSTYRKTKCSDRLYYFNIGRVHVTCWFDGGGDDGAEIAEVLKVVVMPGASGPRDAVDGD